MNCRQDVITGTYVYTPTPVHTCLDYTIIGKHCKLNNVILTKSRTTKWNNLTDNGKNSDKELNDLLKAIMSDDNDLKMLKPDNMFSTKFTILVEQ